MSEIYGVIIILGLRQIYYAAPQINTDMKTCIHKLRLDVRFDRSLCSGVKIVGGAFIFNKVWMKI